MGNIKGFILVDFAESICGIGSENSIKVVFFLFVFLKVCETTLEKKKTHSCTKSLEWRNERKLVLKRTPTYRKYVLCPILSSDQNDPCVI